MASFVTGILLAITFILIPPTCYMILALIFHLPTVNGDLVRAKIVGKSI